MMTSFIPFTRLLRSRADADGVRAPECARRRASFFFQRACARQNIPPVLARKRKSPGRSALAHISSRVNDASFVRRAFPQAVGARPEERSRCPSACTAAGWGAGSPTPTTISRWRIPPATGCLRCRGPPRPTSSWRRAGRTTRTTCCATRYRRTARRCRKPRSSTTHRCCAARGPQTGARCSAAGATIRLKNGISPPTRARRWRSTTPPCATARGSTR